MSTHIVAIEAYDGDTTSVELYNDGARVGALYCIVGIEGGRAEIIDSGYRSYAEAKEAWPEAT